MRMRSYTSRRYTLYAVAVASSCHLKHISPCGLSLLKNMKLLLVSLVWVAVVLSCEVPSIEAVNPGFRTIITQKGLDYGKKIL